ncbi:hypothetical protein LEP1GSC170_6146 [Leptospira interrogans serovar Bataviae str. HAI135]|nr:hypothetical protein LEP1GSC170_6146 [Leptospira interrogans serovar Bataviae str. HAI135]
MWICSSLYRFFIASSKFIIHQEDFHNFSWSFIRGLGQFERKVKPTDKNRMRNEQQNKSIGAEPKYNESKSIPDKPIEIKDLDPYKCFLGWGKTKLFKQQLEYYEQNSDPLKYEGTKKILYEKFVNEVYPGLVSDSEVKKTSIENRKGSAA